MRTLSNQAQAAKCIRKELKAAFPGIKFSVTSTSYSGGNSVYIDWENGPTLQQVQDISDKYQYGNFNGMEDIYEYSNNRTDIPQSKYVQTQREITDDICESMLTNWFQYFKGFERIEGVSNQFIQDGVIRYTLQESWRYLSKMDLREPITRERVFANQ